MTDDAPHERQAAAGLRTTRARLSVPCTMQACAPQSAIRPHRQVAHIAPRTAPGTVRRTLRELPPRALADAQVAPADQLQRRLATPDFPSPASPAVASPQDAPAGARRARPGHRHVPPATTPAGGRTFQETP